MNEHSYIRKIHSLLPRAVYRWKVHDVITNGIPDCYYDSIHGRNLWVEYKWRPTLPKKPDTVIVPELSALQRAWLGERFDRGFDVRVIVGTPQGGIIYHDPDEWIDGITTEHAKKRILLDKDIAAFIEDFLSRPA